MRLVQIMIPAGKRQGVIEALDDEGIDYVITDETSGREFTAVVTFPLPAPAVEPILDRLREVGIDESTYTVIVDAETVISRRFDQLEEEYRKTTQRGPSRISKEELQTKAEELSSSIWSYVMMTVISALIATAGLLLDSPATVVGSMVIAPLIGPALSAAVGTVIDDKDLFARSIRFQAVGVGLSIVSAAVFTTLLRTFNLIPPGVDPLQFAEVAERAAPNLLLLAVAIGAGTAGILSLMTGVSSALVGVMIAVALIPPAAAVGVGIAFGIPQLAIGALVIVLVNIMSINLAALVVLWYAGYRPDAWFRSEEARSAVVKQVAIFAAVIALLSVFLGGVTYDSYASAQTEEEIRDAVETELTIVGGSLELLDLQVTRTGTFPPLETERVVVTVGIPQGETAPGLAGKLQTRIELITDSEVVVEVRFVEMERVE